jgi:hypothetical protein
VKICPGRVEGAVEGEGGTGSREVVPDTKVAVGARVGWAVSGVRSGAGEAGAIMSK